MPVQERITDLLVCWQEERENGRDLPVTELCRNDPDLLSEVERRVVDLRRLTRLAEEIGRGDEPTGEQGPSTDSSAHSPYSTIVGPNRGASTQGPSDRPLVP